MCVRACVCEGMHVFIPHTMQRVFPHPPHPNHQPPQLPQPFQQEAVKEAIKKLPGSPNQPLTIHLRQEIDRLNTVLSLVHTTLKNLLLAIAGTLALTQPLVQAMDALCMARVPGSWVKKSWEAPSIGVWMQGLVLRHAQLHKWLVGGRPKSFWLTGFFNPQVCLFVWWWWWWGGGAFA